jgi:hypothetical protein
MQDSAGLMAGSTLCCTPRRSSRPAADGVAEGLDGRCAPARIAVVGAQGGSSVLVHQIAETLGMNWLKVARTDDLFQRAARHRLPTMEAQNGESTEWLIAQAVADEIAADHAGYDVVVSDATPISAVAGYLAALELRREPPDPAELLHLCQAAAEHAARYDLLLAAVFEPECANHSPSLQYQMLMDKHVHRLLSRLLLDRVVVTSSPESQEAAIWRAIEVGRAVLAA